MKVRSLLLFVLAGCTAPASPSAPAPTNPPGKDPHASTTRELRIQGRYQYVFEISDFKPCSQPSETWWLDAGPEFWERLYAFGPDHYVVLTDSSPRVEIDVTGIVETLDGPHWMDPGSRITINGYGHLMAYRARIEVTEVHDIRPMSGPGSERESLCP